MRRWLVIALCLCLLVVAEGALRRRLHKSRHRVRGGPYVLSKRVNVTDEQLAGIRTFLAKNKWTVPGDQTFWHWTTIDNCLRLSRQGKMDAGEMDFLNSQHKNMAAGGGLYIAHDPYTSSTYGQCPLEVTVRGESLILVESDLNDPKFKTFVNNVALNDVEKVNLGKLIAFVHNHGPRITTPTWWVTHNIETIKSITIGVGKNWVFADMKWLAAYKSVRFPPSFATTFGFQFSESHPKYKDTKLDTTAKLFDFLWKARDAVTARGASFQDAIDTLNWLESFFHLMQYADGITLITAIKAGKNPWETFDPQFFQPFREYNTQILKTRIAAKAGDMPWGTSKPGSTSFGGNGSGSKEWPERMIAMLNGIYKAVSGGASTDYRRGEVRAGGDDINKTFRAGDRQVLVMEANQYLLVHKVPNGEKTWQVYYYYPDAYQLNPKLKPRVSPALWAAMEGNRSAYATNKALWAQHTYDLMKELTFDAFLTSWSKVLADMAGITDLMLKLVSVHPRDNFNGRSTRMIAFQMALDLNVPLPPVGFITDFDLALPVSDYLRMLTAQTAAYHKLRLEMLANALTAIAKKEMAKHYEMKAWDVWVQECMAPISPKPIAFSADDWPLVEKRRWVELFDKKYGNKDWRFR